MAGYSQFVLLVFFTVQYGEAIEYYVKPIATHNISCPLSQPCLNINQYTDPSNNYLELNNTVFTFLPGKHVMERPMEFSNVENITLQGMEGDYPQLLPMYICSSGQIFLPYDDMILSLPLQYYCSTIQLKKVSNVTISRLIIGAAVNISGIIIENSVNINIQQNNIISTKVELVNVTNGFGVFINRSIRIIIESLLTRHVVFGVLISEVNDAMIQKSSFQDSLYSGLLYMFETNHIKLLNKQ